MRRVMQERTAPQADVLARMVRVPCGTFLTGPDRHRPQEDSAHHVCVDPFWIDETAFTSTQFATFVGTTGYITVSEQRLYPDVAPEMRQSGSLVFHGRGGANPSRPSCCGWPGESFDPIRSGIRIPWKVVEGSFFLCALSYCRRYRPAARQASGMSHIGFRCVRHGSAEPNQQQGNELP